MRQEGEMLKWTKDEMRWISRAKRLFKQKPAMLEMYTTDGEISICKIGISSEILNETISESGLHAGATMSDMHDAGGESGPCR